MAQGVCVAIVPAGSALSTDEGEIRARGRMYALPADVNDLPALQRFVSTLAGVSDRSAFSYLQTYVFGDLKTQGWAECTGQLPHGPLHYMKVETPPGRSLDAVFAEWKSAYGNFITKFNGLEVKPDWGVPVGPDGRPLLLFHRLHERWTEGTDAWRLLNYARQVKRPICIPLMGVSGCGKTRTLYEILASNWGFFWTASHKRNGGSLDMQLVGVTAVGLSDPNSKQHQVAVMEMKKLVLTRLLILSHVRSVIPDLTPEQWLILQVQFNHFYEDDPYRRLAKMLIDDYHFKEGDLTSVWRTVRSDLNCKPIFVMDEAQTLNGMRQFLSPQSGKLRAKFSPVMKALMDDDFGVPVFVSGTVISFLELEADINSLVGKMRGSGLPTYVIKFHKWEKPREVYDFCSKYLPVLNLGASNCALLFENFKGRKRCLVTCLEELLLKGCCWSQETVDFFYAELTTGNSMDFAMSLYTMVAKFFQEGKGTFGIRGQDLSATELVIRAVSHYCFSNRTGLLLETAEAELLSSGIGWCDVIRSWGSRSSYEIYEPMVLETMRNYCVDNNHVERHLQVLMQTVADDASACGTLWEKLMVIRIPRFLDGQKPLSSWSCFKGVVWHIWDAAVPNLVGLTKQVWRETPVTPLATYLKLPADKRPMFFMFSSLSGPDIMFFVSLDGVLTPVFLQLKLRYRVQWDQAEGTTNPYKMYRRASQEVSKEACPAIREACFYGCLGLVVAYPACNRKAPRWDMKQSRRLVGYLGKEELEDMFSSELCDFLATIKPDIPDYRMYKTTLGSLRTKRVKLEDYDVFFNF